MGSQVDMYTCTDACTYFNQGVGPKAGRLGHSHSNTYEHPSSMYLCTDGLEFRTQVNISTCTDAYIHPKQGVGTEMR